MAPRPWLDFMAKTMVENPIGALKLFKGPSAKWCQGLQEFFQNVAKYVVRWI